MLAKIEIYLEISNLPEDFNEEELINYLSFQFNISNELFIDKKFNNIKTKIVESNVELL